MSNKTASLLYWCFEPCHAELLATHACFSVSFYGGPRWTMGCPLT